MSGSSEKPRRRSFVRPPRPASDVPGGRAMPAGSLSKPHFGPQGDESRDPRDSTHVPTSPTPTAETDSDQGRQKR
jgi:hypothetical protein